MRLRGQVAVIIGGGRGIGRSVALACASEGATIIVVDPGGSRDGRPDGSSPADEVIREIKANGGGGLSIAADVSDFAAAESVTSEIVAKFGAIDILVHTGAVLRERMIWNMPEDDWDSVLRVHLKIAYNMSRHIAPSMRERRHGRILLMTSQAWLGTVGQSNYAAAKGAIWSLTRALARELGRYGVTCNSVSPTAGTRLTNDPKAQEGFKKRLEAGLIDQKRYEQLTNVPGPEFIAPLVTWLCTAAAADINGQNFRCTRGRISTFTEPQERSTLITSKEDGMFTLDDLDRHFVDTLMDGVKNPAPRQNT